MKKSVIIVTVLVYLISIVVVAFLGYVAEIHNPPLYAEDIVMVINDEIYAPETEADVYTYTAYGTPIYDIFYNPNADPNAEDSSRYRYQFKFRGYDEYEYYYDEINLIQMHLMPYSSKGECDNLNLSYYIDDSRDNYISVDTKGEVTLKKKLALGNESIMVSTKDGTNIKIYINIYW